MGNSASSGRGHHEETVDFGYLTPQGIYTGPRDWNQTIVAQLIVERKLAPFYRPLEDYDESWDDEQILAARKEPAEVEGAQSETSSSRVESANPGASRIAHHKRASNAKESPRTPNPEAAIYRGAVECPICFLVSSTSKPSMLLGPEVVRPSIIPRTSIIHGVVTKPSALNVSCRLNVQILRQHISSRSQPHARTVYKRNSV